MRNPIHCTCILAMALAACSAETPLSLADKVKATAELIAARPDCTEYSKKLASSTIDSKQVDQTYQAAKAAHCIKPDV